MFYINFEIKYQKCYLKANKIRLTTFFVEDDKKEEEASGEEENEIVEE